MVRFVRSLFGRRHQPPAATAAEVRPVSPAPEAKPIHVTDDTFGQLVLGSPLPALVDFWAPWCGPCRMVAPLVEELARTYEGHALIAKVDTDENTRVATELGIMGIPTLILFKDGQEVDRVVGYAPGHVLEDKLKAILG
jgi:thioredoxin 1